MTKMSFANRGVLGGGSTTRSFFWRLVLATFPALAACGHASTHSPWPDLGASAGEYLLPQGGLSHVTLPPSSMPQAKGGPMAAWQYSRGPNLRQAGSPLALLETQGQSLEFRLPLNEALTAAGRWQSQEQAFGYGGDSSAVQWQRRQQGWDQALGLQLSPRCLATAHLLLPLGPGAQGFASGAALEIGDADSTGALARLQGEWGRSGHTVTAMVPGYLPVTIASELENHSLLVGLGWNAQGWRASSSGAYHRLGTSASGDAAFANHVHATLTQGAVSVLRRFSSQAMPWSLEAQAEGLAGQGHEVGYRGPTGLSEPFAWVPWKLQAGRASLRLASESERYCFGLDGQIAGGVLRLLRPLHPAGHWLWNRNQILDAYQGSLTGLLSRESWTGVGRAAFHREGANAFAQRHFRLGAWDLSPGLDLGLHRMAWEGWARLTQSQTSLLLYTTEKRDTLVLAPRNRWLLQPGAAMCLRRGQLQAKASVTQMLPLSYNQADRTDPESGQESPSSEWRGGMEIHFSLHYSR